LENLVVVFRNSKLTPAQQIAFGRRFGKPTLSYSSRVPFPDHPELAVLLHDETSKTVVGDMWHSDGSVETEPPSATMLYMLEPAPNGGGDTLFTSTQLAYDSLSESMKNFLGSLTAVHDRKYPMLWVALRSKRWLWRTAAAAPQSLERGGAGPERHVRSWPSSEVGPPPEHPVVRTHPETGKKGLFVNRSSTSHIVQLEKAESDVILSFLYDHIEQPIHQCRVKWEAGSLTLWDNRSAQHLALGDYFPHRRLAHRLMIAGDRPR
jgi:taurine dioxygenase